MDRFFKTLFRTIRKNPLYSFINLAGLILGFSCIILIAIWIQNELSYDKFHKNSEEIYRVHRYFYDPDGKENLHLEFVAPPVAPMLEKEIKEIEHIARMYHMEFNFAKGDHVSQEYISFAEPEILEYFPLKDCQMTKTFWKRP